MKYLIQKTRAYPLEYTVSGPDNLSVTFKGLASEDLANEYVTFKRQQSQPSQ